MKRNDLLYSKYYDKFRQGNILVDVTGNISHVVLITMIPKTTTKNNNNKT